MMADWPRVLLTTVTFEEEGAQTRMRLTWVPHEASDAETACFAAAMGGMDKGWGAGMELLAEAAGRIAGLSCPLEFAVLVRHHTRVCGPLQAILQGNSDHLLLPERPL